MRDTPNGVGSSIMNFSRVCSSSGQALRIEHPGAIYHVTSRGNARQAIYKDDADRAAFLTTLEAVVERFDWLCHAYCLIGNHYHLLIETPDGNLSKGMRELNGCSAQA